jgi:hypothetical protein
MIPVETVVGFKEEGWESSGGGGFKHDISDTL